MPNRAQRVLTQAQQQLDTEAFSALLRAIGSPQDKASPAKQAKYIHALLDLLQTQGEEVCAAIMRPCGYTCISDGTTKKACTVKASVNGDIDLLLDKLNEMGIGGGHLRLDGNRVLASYDRCYCGIARAETNMPVVYCECSAGWYERLFSALFGPEVRVKILQTILAGQDKCEFEILI